MGVRRVNIIAAHVFFLYYWVRNEDVGSAWPKDGFIGELINDILLRQFDKLYNSSHNQMLKFYSNLNFASSADFSINFLNLDFASFLDSFLLYIVAKFSKLKLVCWPTTWFWYAGHVEKSALRVHALRLTHQKRIFTARDFIGCTWCTTPPPWDILIWLFNLKKKKKSDLLELANQATNKFAIKTIMHY